VDEALPFGPLLKCLERENGYITQKASAVITSLLWCVGRGAGAASVGGGGGGGDGRTPNPGPAGGERVAARGAR
jgi:hypothetical protein